MGEGSKFSTSRMANPFKSPLGYIIGGAVVCVIFFMLAEWDADSGRFVRRGREVEVDEVKPQSPKLDILKDDQIEDKRPRFDPALVDSRLQQSRDGSLWLLNASDAVLKLDIEETREDDVRFAPLFLSYQAATTHFRQGRFEVLPSINLLDGKAKQFDDGLMAAMMMAAAPGHVTELAWLPDFLKRLRIKLPPESNAYAWVSCALDLGGYLEADALGKSPARATQFRKNFLQSAEAKPISFYTWSPDLERVWRFVRFLQQPLREQGASFGEPVCKVLLADEPLKRDYEKMLLLFDRVSNPSAERTLLKGGDYFLSPMRTHENAVVDRILGGGQLSPEVELMQEFVKAIRSGKVDLKPRQEGGWYDYQIYALETFLLPERGLENQKLLLTKKYKQRMLEAFKALVTKRRETQVMFAVMAKSAQMIYEAPLIAPRLRVEPNPTYYLRMARSYAFIETALPAFFPATEWQAMVGMKEGGVRSKPLKEELAWMKHYFYGLHLIACEDIGMKPTLLEGELLDAAAAKKLAEEYLAHWEQDADLAVDTRVSVPIADMGAGFRLWSVLGVKGIQLKAGYASPPKGRPKDAPKGWQPNDAAVAPPPPAPVEKVDDSVAAKVPDDVSQAVAQASQWETLETGEVHYVLLVDEFAEVTSPVILNRTELRVICDREQTKEKIVAAIGKGK